MKPSQGSFPSTATGETVWLGFTEWGPRSNERVAICVHGLTRQGRDFDRLAHALQPDYRVVCPDVAGRGRSGWLFNKTDYHYGTYVKHAHDLLAYRGLGAVDWIGTSMGGLIGMLLAAQEDSPIRRLVLNDIGPFIPKAALERIGRYVGEELVFPSLAAVDQHFRKIYASYGDLSDSEWSEMVLHSVERQPNHTYTLHLDPAIGDAFKKTPLQDVDMWSIWDRIECPVLLIRGANSDVLLPETAREMTRRGPKAELVEIPDCGHAPALMSEAQTDIIRDWLHAWVEHDIEEEEAAKEAAQE
ncbi:MAG: alpha/beta hydrolase [Alphaproteobacteria bacterium]|nr:alpha/beta hydrolase [Alphaproteobacteria bacterium]MBU0798940.1 alpha/beta hydrolase [Alphaproteobacteria bacterium]MBU0885677.1 alpha/beta hydrolase [Alphaproteobacteria bacterium]MBU1812667.1 alpha/beta hydrolase [Alphaproteobacteria bacterium]MBU2089704.1 alpha/beta hydrolase [Alphaproteobacteria bacterium]